LQPGCRRFESHPLHSALSKTTNPLRNDFSGDAIVADFLKILEEYVERRYKKPLSPAV